MQVNARYRDERAARIWLRDASVLRIGTISRHVWSAIGAPIQEVLLASGSTGAILRPESWLRRSDAFY